MVEMIRDESRIEAAFVGATRGARKSKDVNRSLNYLKSVNNVRGPVRRQNRHNDSGADGQAEMDEIATGPASLIELRDYLPTFR